MQKVKFLISDIDAGDKDIVIEENCGEYLALKIIIDFDDVERSVVERKAKRLLDILNTHW